MSKEIITIKKLDNLTVKITQKDSKKSKKVETESKKIVLGFHQIDPFIEKKLLESPEITLNNVYKFDVPEKDFYYEVNILKVSRPSKQQTEERELILKLRDKTLQQTIDLADNATKIYSLEQELKVKGEEYKKLAGDFQTKAQKEINKFREENYENSKKEIQEIKKYALQDFFEEFLVSLDNLEMAAKAGEKSQNAEVAAYTKGFTMLLSRIENTLNNYGVTKIIPKVGETFDAHIHQVFELADENKPKETILKVKNIGYKLHDRVIKPALVIVQK